jgi:hypothetical protein
MVEAELASFDQSVCTFFSVDRIHPDVRINV